MAQLRYKSNVYYPVYKQKVVARGSVPIFSNSFGNVMNKPRKVKLVHPQVRNRLTELPPLRHDFINFKVMSGNEILLNLENSKYLRNSELVNALLELGKRKGQEKHDWEIHPYTKLAFDEVKKRIGQFTGKHLSQLCMAFDRLNYNNVDFWDKVKVEILKLLHTFNGLQLAGFLDIMVPRLEDDLEDDDIIYLDKEIEKKQKMERADNEFLQRIINIFPIHLKDFHPNVLTRVSEVCVQRDLGDDRFFKEFLFFYVEKRIVSFKIPLYIRILRVLGEKGYTSDIIFWNSFIFPRIYIEPLNQTEAHQIWEALIALRMKCPELNCEIPINYIESLLKKFELIEGFEEFEQEIQDQIREEGDLPSDVKRTISTASTLTGTNY